MKNPAVAEGQRLVVLLHDALAREARLWKVPVFKGGCIQGTDISLYEQQNVIQWLGEMSRLFQFCPETFALGACVLTRLVSTVKAQPKYLKCIAFTSLILAAKINEEDEVIGSVKDLVAQSGCNFSTAEILRMEKIILDKLNWDLYTATPVDFIHIFHAMLASGHPHLIPSIGSGQGRGTDPGSVSPTATVVVSPPPGRQKRPSGFQVALWTRQVQHCMACHQLWQFKGSTLALAIITLELEALTPDWFSIFTELLKKAQVESAEFIHCKEMVDQHLNNLEFFSLPPNAVYILNGAQLQEDEDEAAPRPEQHHFRRWGRGRGRGHCGAGQGDLEYCDGFGCLYNDEGTVPERDGSEGLRNNTTTQHENISPCPPLHPPMI